MTEMLSTGCFKRTSPFAAINPVHQMCQQCLPGTDGWQFPMHIFRIREAAPTAAEVQHADAILLQHIAQTPCARMGFRQEQGSTSVDISQSNEVVWWQTASRGS